MLVASSFLKHKHGKTADHPHWKEAPWACPTGGHPEEPMLERWLGNTLVPLEELEEVQRQREVCCHCNPNRVNELRKEGVGSVWRFLSVRAGTIQNVMLAVKKALNWGAANQMKAKAKAEAAATNLDQCYQRLPNRSSAPTDPGAASLWKTCTPLGCESSRTPGGEWFGKNQDVTEKNKLWPLRED